jgi:hypothetical protein
LPLEQLPEVLEKRKCDAIVLSGTCKPTKKLFSEQLPTLVKKVNIPVFIGGNMAERYQGELENTGAIYSGADIHIGLETIRKTLGR